MTPALARPVPGAVLQKELRLRLRSMSWVVTVTVYVAILEAVALGFLLQRYGPSSGDASRAGIQLFQSLSLAELTLMVLAAPALLAGAIAGERQNRTWDLLLVTRLSPGRIAGAKLLAGIALLLLLLVASIPLYSLDLVFGGLSAAAALHTLIVFLATILLLTTLTVTLSALTRRVVTAYLLSFFLAFLLTGALAFLTLYLQQPSQPGFVDLAGIPFSGGSPAPLSPLAQLDPLVALLSALPAVGGGSVLGELGTVHAFGLPWHLSLWAAFALLATVISAGLFAFTGLVLRRPFTVKKPPRPSALSATALKKSC